MHLTFRNVNDAFESLVKEFHYGTIATVQVPSRNGPVLMVEGPVIITYTQPLERVLFNRARDCNPFFHLFESLWMLAGRNDVAPLAYYNSKISDYSDDGQTFNGAYGYRWRHAEACSSDDRGYQVDQLQLVIDHLTDNPTSRRAVLQMWNVEDDLLQVNTSKDVCCNLCVMFSIRKESLLGGGYTALVGGVNYLDMTVVNRSNDMIWGMLGANVFHFSVLQEYMAAKLGVKVGVYNQFTNNLHVYLDNFEPNEWLDSCDQPCLVTSGFPLIKDPEVFDRELESFVTLNSESCTLLAARWKEPFFQQVAQPMCNAFHYHKRREYVMAFSHIMDVQDPYLTQVCVSWLTKRKLAWEGKQNAAK